MSLKPQVYKDPRPAEYFTRFHDRVRRGRPDWVYQLVRMVLTPYLLLFYRVQVHKKVGQVFYADHGNARIVDAGA